MSLAEDVAQICAKYNVNFLPNPIRVDGSANAQLMADIMRLLTITLERKVCTARPECMCQTNGHPMRPQFQRFGDIMPTYTQPNNPFGVFGGPGCPYGRFGDVRY